jgi:hypothetical protein
MMLHRVFTGDKVGRDCNESVLNDVSKYLLLQGEAWTTLRYNNNNNNNNNNNFCLNVTHIP